MTDGVLAWLSVWNSVQMIDICTGWYHYHHVISCFIIVHSILFFFCRLCMKRICWTDFYRKLRLDGNTATTDRHVIMCMQICPPTTDMWLHVRFGANMPACNWYVITCMQICPPTTTFQQSVESVEFVVSMSRLCTYVLHIITPTALLSGCSCRDGDAAFCQVTVDTCWLVEWHSGRTSVSDWRTTQVSCARPAADGWPLCG